MYWLIQGIFFQNQSWLGVRCVPIEGDIVVIERGLIQTLFSGVIGPDTRSSVPTLMGEMLDPIGMSLLTDVWVSDTEVRFTKNYRKRGDIGAILYTFSHKEGSVFVGNYEGLNVGNGIARCVLTPVEPTFFDPFSAAKLLGRSSVHEWPAEKPPSNL